MMPKRIMNHDVIKAMNLKKPDLIVNQSATNVRNKKKAKSLKLATNACMAQVLAMLYVMSVKRKNKRIKKIKQL